MLHDTEPVFTDLIYLKHTLSEISDQSNCYSWTAVA